MRANRKCLFHTTFLFARIHAVPVCSRVRVGKYKPARERETGLRKKVYARTCIWEEVQDDSLKIDVRAGCVGK